MNIDECDEAHGHHRTHQGNADRSPDSCRRVSLPIGDYGRRRVSAGIERACQAAAADDDESVRARETHTKGGIKDNGKESQGREEEGRQETVS